MNARYCRSCRARIDWVTLPTGRRMPINPEPDRERGNVMLIDTELDADVYDTVVGRFVVLGEVAALMERQRGIDLYLSHFESCPEAESWRTSRHPAAPKQGPERRDLE